MLYEKLLRPVLFALDPEDAHDMMTRVLSVAQDMPLLPGAAAWAFGSGPKGLETEVWGLKFENPIGLAAGYDKDCRMTRILPTLGFGFIEVGSITLRPQGGNPKPRVFRLAEQQGVINRLGFNGGGVDVAARRLAAPSSGTTPLGINLGLNADCPKEKAHEEYAETFRKLREYGDYFVVNVSSPNTTGLRDLQERAHLEKILAAIQAENPDRKPLLVKLSPDLSDEQLTDILGPIQARAAGVIATNTTLSREGLPPSASELRGGLSGAPLKSRSTELIRKIRRLTAGRLPIIGVGGVSSGADAFEKLRAGASLVQLYTGLIYRGPGVVRRIQRELAKLMAASGFKSIADAVGSEARA